MPIQGYYFFILIRSDAPFIVSFLQTDDRLGTGMYEHFCPLFSSKITIIYSQTMGKERMHERERRMLREKYRKRFPPRVFAPLPVAGSSYEGGGGGDSDSFIISSCQPVVSLF